MIIHQEVERRYLLDPYFHAKVQQAVLTIQQEAHITFDEHDRSLATLAAGVAIHLQETRPLSS